MKNKVIALTETKTPKLPFLKWKAKRSFHKLFSNRLSNSRIAQLQEFINKYRVKDVRGILVYGSTGSGSAKQNDEINIIIVKTKETVVGETAFLTADVPKLFLRLANKGMIDVHYPADKLFIEEENPIALSQFLDFNKVQPSVNIALLSNRDKIIKPREWLVLARTEEEAFTAENAIRKQIAKLQDSFSYY